MKLQSIILLIFLINLVCLIKTFDRKEPRVTFLDVGQGDATLVRDGSTDFLIDGGPDSAILYSLAAVRPAWDNTIEMILVTHPEQDHLGGLMEVTRRYDVGLVLMSSHRHESELYNDFLEQLKRRNIPVAFVRAGNEINKENFILKIISPDEKQLEQNKSQTNNLSLVSLLLFGGKSILLTGDIEAATEQYLLRQNKITRADIIKVPHHGSKTSSSAGFVNIVQPSLAVISVGKDNSYGHPHTEIIKRYGRSHLLRTDNNGSIMLSLSPKNKELRLRCGKGCGI